MLTIPNLLAWSAQAAIVVAATLAAVRILRLDEPAVKYALLRAALACCLALPLISLVVPAPTAAGRPGVASDVTGVTLDGAAGGAAPAAWLVPPEALAAAIAVLLVAGVLARLTWIGIGTVRLRRLRRAGEAAVFEGMHDELQGIIGTRAAIRYVKGLGQPVTFGFRAPVILLPQSLQAQHPAIQRAVLAHELWHVRRRDWIWTVAEEGLRALFWFHPAIWLLLSRIQAVREEVVDQLTILATGSRRSYVDALLVYADERPLFSATAFAQRRHLVHRLVLISKEAVMSARRVIGSCAVVACVVLSAGWYAVQAFPLAQAQDGREIWSQSPGPVERRAKPLTPENPVPRRTYYVAPDYPAEAAGIQARGSATVRVTLDESGHLAEARVTGLSVMLGDGQASVGFSGTGTADNTGLIDRLTRSLPADRQPAVRRALEAIGASAIRAVRQWQYDMPADGPISFPVTVNVAPDLDPPGAAAPPTLLAQEVRPEWDGALRVGGNIKAPTKIRHVNPVYPPVAREASVQGVVILEARIGPNGTVEDARVLRSIPLLDQAALEAVMQWQFTPTLLNGAPVSVIMTVTVNFTLQ